MGSAADRFGRYKVAGISLLLLSATTLLHLKAWSVAAFVVIRMLHGFFAAAVTPSSLAAATDGIAPTRRGQIMARVGLMIALASIVAPPVAGRMVDMLALSTTVRIQALFLLVVGAAGILARQWAPHPTTAGSPTPRLAEPVEHPVGQADPALAVSETLAPSPDPTHDTSTTPKMRDMLDPKVTAFACIVGFSIMFAQNILFYALPLKAVALQLGPATIGGLFGVFAIGAAIAFMPPFGRLADRFGRIPPILLGSTLAAIGMFMLGQGVAQASIAYMSASLFLYGFGFGVSFPAVSAAAADGAEAPRRGTAFGLLTASFSMGAILGPVVAQALDRFTSPFTVGAVFMVLGLGAIVLTRHAPSFYRVPTRA